MFLRYLQLTLSLGEHKISRRIIERALCKNPSSDQMCLVTPLQKVLALLGIGFLGNNLWIELSIVQTEYISVVSQLKFIRKLATHLTILSPLNMSLLKIILELFSAVY